MAMKINKGCYDLIVKNGEAIVSISNIESTDGYALELYATDFLNLMNIGGDAYLKTVDGNYIDIYLNLKNGHLYTPNNHTNIYLTKKPRIDALKKELSNLISATYTEERGLPW